MFPNSKNFATKRQATEVSELERAFVDVKLSMRAVEKGAVIPETKDIDIRTWFVSHRSALRLGEKIPIYIDNVLVAEITKPMLKVTSQAFDELYQNGKIQLPQDTEKTGVIRLVDYLTYVARTSKKPIPMSKGMSTFDALSVCAAAQVMAMDKYTDHVYKMCEAVLRKDPPTYEDIDAILAFKHQHGRLFLKVVDYLAVRVWDETIPDPEEFQDYLAKNPALKKAITKANEAHSEKLRIDTEFEERHLQREEARARWEEVEKRKDAIKKAKEERDMAIWAEKNAKRAALEKSCKEKSQGPLEKGKKFSPDERAHWMRTRSTQPPKCC